MMMTLINEMLGTKLRALFQRRRGRDLFDLYWALTRAKPAVVPAQIIESFQHYLKLEGSLARHLNLADFRVAWRPSMRTRLNCRGMMVLDLFG